MKGKTLHQITVIFMQRFFLVPILLASLVFWSCGQKTNEEIAKKGLDTILSKQTIYASQILKSEMVKGNLWEKINKDSIVLIRFKFYNGLASPEFKLVSYFTVRKKFGEKEVPMELSVTEKGASLPTKNVIIGNLDLNWNNIVNKIMLPDSTIDPLFHHVLLEPNIKQNHLYFTASLRKEDGSLYKDISIAASPLFTGTPPDWELADANPSPPAKPNE